MTRFHGGAIAIEAYQKDWAGAVREILFEAVRAAFFLGINHVRIPLVSKSQNLSHEVRDRFRVLCSIRTPASRVVASPLVRRLEHIIRLTLINAQCCPKFIFRAYWRARKID